MPTKSSRVVIGLCVVAAVLFGAGTSGAAPAPLADYTMASWSRRDGIVAPVWSIAQDHDGYLWVGTGSGLLRFDGHRFVTWESLGYEPLSGNTILALLNATDGSLWISVGEAGIGRLLNGVFTFYRDLNGLAFTRTLVQDRRGDIWAGSRAGLSRFDGTRWALQRESVGLPASPISGLYDDAAGALWVQTLQGHFRRDPSRQRFEAVTETPAFARPLTATSGRDAPSAAWNPFHAYQDRRGDIWLPTLGQGLNRLRFDGNTPTLERVTKDAALSDNVVGAVFEDRDSNIWIGTQAGLHELTPRTVTPLDDLGAVTVVQATSDGSTWFGSDKGLIRLTTDRRFTYTERDGLPPGPVRALFTDRRDRLWVATDRGLGCFENGRFVAQALSEPRRFGRITAGSIDSHETVWLTDFQFGVMRLQNHVLTPLDTVAHADHGRAFSAYVDWQDRVWIGFADGHLGLLQADGRIATHDLGIKGAISVVADDADGALWIGGENGIARLTDGTSAAATTDANGFPGSHVTAVVSDGRGAVWAGTSVGIVRIDRREFDAIASNPSHRIQYTLLDEADGLQGVPVHLATPSAVRSEDGRLWFVTSGGATVVDPASTPRTPRPPQVRIEEIRADGRRVTPTAPFDLAPRPGRVDIDYTALAFTSPTAVRFQYQLSGFESQWQEAGARRQASYTNLGPGRYTFRVIARDKEGVFDPAGASVTFSVLPAFYQTTWFFGGTAAACVALGAVAWRLRVRQIRERFSLVLAERARISREVHDTLLQSLVGVALRSGTVADRLLSDPADAREQLNRMRKDVEEQIREARQTIWNLRSPTLHQRGLAGAIQDSGERIAQQTGARFTFDVAGTPGPCPPAVEEHILRIGQEALINAGRHSGASDIRAELRYDAGVVALRVVDNGTGFDVSTTGNDGDRHFGLTHMRERAAQAGGHVEITSSGGAGTQVVASFPLSPRGAA